MSNLSLSNPTEVGTLRAEAVISRVLLRSMALPEEFSGDPRNRAEESQAITTTELKGLVVTNCSISQFNDDIMSRQRMRRQSTPVGTKESEKFANLVLKDEDHSDTDLTWEDLISRVDKVKEAVAVAKNVEDDTSNTGDRNLRKRITLASYVLSRILINIPHDVIDPEEMRKYQKLVDIGVQYAS